MSDTSTSPLGLGIDAGGTETRWALSRADGTIVADGRVGGLSALQMSTAEGRQYISRALEAIATEAQRTGRPRRVYAGLTGLTSLSDGDANIRALIAQSFGIADTDVELGTDIEIAYLDLFKPGEGYVVYAGTGSVAAYIDAAGEVHRAGGRGMILDDGGGGAWIAREALRLIWRAEDTHPGAWRDSALARAMFERIGGSDWADTRQFVYGRERGEIGRLALAVAITADEDPVAEGILLEAGKELARLAQAMLDRFGRRPIAVAGRAASMHPAIERAMRAALPPEIELTLRASEAHAAAARIAARRATA